jgi:hypothetical protein
MHESVPQLSGWVAAIANRGGCGESWRGALYPPVVVTFRREVQVRDYIRQEV